MFYTGMYFVIALFILVVVHELGHFLVARFCGVKVLRFSFGFGRVLASWQDKRKTEYVWSLLPLGGYVKMLDESEGEVLDEERHLAFNNQSLLVRVAVVLAGPLFNFILAFLLLWIVLIVGVKSIAPIIGDVRDGSVAANSGLGTKQEIVAFDGKKISSWRDFQYALMPMIGSSKDALITVKSLKTGNEETFNLSMSKWKLNSKSTDVLDVLGIMPFVPKVPPIVGKVLPDSPSMKSGIAVGDKILSIDKKSIDSWTELVQFVKNNPDKEMVLLVKRDGMQISINIHSGNIEKSGKREGFLGLQSTPVKFPDNFIRIHRSAPIPALHIALMDTYELTKTTFTLIGRMIGGSLSVQSLSGPIGIAKGAADSARTGFVYYLSFIALLSISLGVLNLLPIPMLDGGHLFYYLIEGIRGRSLSNEFKIKSAYVGLGILLVLTVVALTNDLTKMVGA
jgi:regulator of sigma E protease